MSPRNLAVCVALLGLALAGCLGAPGPDRPAADGPSGVGDGGYDLDLTDPDVVGPGNWTLISLQADDDGALVGTGLTVTETFRSPSGDLGAPTRPAILDVVPLIPDDDRDAIRAWGVFVFPHLDGDGRRYQMTASTRHTVRNITAPTTADATTVPATVEPRTLMIDADPTQSVPIVVAARTDEPIDVDVAVRFRDDAPKAELGELDRAIQRVEDADAVAPADVVGTGSGFRIAGYASYTPPGAAQEVVIRSEPITVRDELPADTRPVASARRLTVEYRYPTDAGWGLGFGVEAGEIEATRWSAAVDLHGASARAEGVTGGALGVSTWKETGFPMYYAMAGGSGDAEARLSVTQAATGRARVAMVYHVQFGATLETLVGVESPDAATTYDGSLPRPTFDLDVRDDSLTIDGPDGRIDILAPR